MPAGVVSFTPKNHALIRNRIVKLLRRHSLKTYEEYWSLLEKGSHDLVQEYISALTTNMTSFYRESNHFEFMEKAIPELAAKFGSELRVWCAAASTGQEPYTLAMTVFSVIARDAKFKIRCACDRYRLAGFEKSVGRNL